MKIFTFISISFTTYLFRFVLCSVTLLYDVPSRTVLEVVLIINHIVPIPLLS